MIRASSLDWTIIRACWLFHAARVPPYEAFEDSIRGAPITTAKSPRAVAASSR